MGGQAQLVGALGVVLSGVLLATRGGNPSQSIGQLFELIRNGGVPMSESVDSFSANYKDVTGNDQHSDKDENIANSFYNLVTQFYEYGWGDSFHFGPRRAHDAHEMSTRNAQHFMALKLQLKDMERVADLGCGVGGPLRSIVRFTGANVTGVTINKFQIGRFREYLSPLSEYMKKRSHIVYGNFFDLVPTFEPESFDAVYYMESTLHVENRTETFKEAYKILKPGGRLFSYEYTNLGAYKETDPYHKDMMRLYMLGNGAARLPTVRESLKMITDAGFQLVEHDDAMRLNREVHGEEDWPWWMDLQFTWRPQLLTGHPWARKALSGLAWVMTGLRIWPKDVYEVQSFLEDGAVGISELGRLGILTPHYYVLARKPLPKT